LNCQYCGKQETLPFVCNYCGGVYCADHRLPENHACTGDLSRKPVVETSTSTFSWNEGASSTIRPSVSHSFSRRELRDILIAWLGLGFAFTFALSGGLISGFSERLGVQDGPTTYYFSPVDVLGIALVTVGAGFVLHELMHKFTSERYGFHAEFRMWPQGLLLALGLSVFTGFVFAAPGATYIDGYGLQTKENGIISVAGPLTNIAIALLFFPLTFVNNATLFEVGALGSYINLFLAAFNMLPLMPLDGAKVWRWNKLYWTGVFVPLAAIVGAYFLGYLQVI
jgi:Zn-dependent protease